VTPDIKSLTAAELAEQFRQWGLPAYRLTQVLEWLYRRRVTRWEEMTNLPKALRQQLSQAFTLHTLQLVRHQGAADATQKFLWRLADGALIESVLIPASPALYGQPSDRRTLCVSTQVGCAYGCRFCASGLAGFQRNLQPHEIVEQVLATERWHAAIAAAQPPPDQAAADPIRPAPAALAPASPVAPVPPPAPPRRARLVDNLVIMGMGEPLANYDNLLRALRILNAPWGGGIGARRITISTSGLAPQIRRLAAEPEQFRLAVSLHGATDAVRSRLMPVNRKFPLDQLTAALAYYRATKGRSITLEYVLIAGVNDSPAEARPLAALARRLRAKINLIPYNAVAGLKWKRPEDTVCEAFLLALKKLKVNATLRREKGHDIDAACGQLRLQTEREQARRAS